MASSVLIATPNDRSASPRIDGEASLRSMPLCLA